MSRSLSVMSLLTAVVLFSFVLVVAAIAEEGATIPDADKAGRLTAEGDGRALVFARGAVVEITGEGDLWVSKDAKVEITGTAGTKIAQEGPPRFRPERRGPRPEGEPGDQRDGGRRPGGGGGPDGPMPPGEGGTPPSGPRPGGSALMELLKPQPGYLYQGMKGTARITGESFTLALECDKQKLSLHGHGGVLLTGEGSYTLEQPAKKEQTGSWNAPPSRERRSRPEPVFVGKIEKLEDLVAK